jgi:hypothetical protein
MTGQTILYLKHTFDKKLEVCNRKSTKNSITPWPPAVYMLVKNNYERGKIIAQQDYTHKPSKCLMRTDKKTSVA